MQHAVTAVAEMIGADVPQAIVSVNPEKVIRAQRDPALLQFLRDASLLIPDGIGVVLAARLLGLARMQRTPGSELMPAICGLAARNGYRIFLFGGSPHVNARTAEVLSVRYPGIRIAGRQHGYLQEEEVDGLIDGINKSDADILFVALGSPGQETWMANNLPRLTVSVCQGAGGTFDVISGQVKRAPKIFRKFYLEWFYRLISQPRRLLRQTALPKFAMQVLREMVFGR